MIKLWCFSQAGARGFSSESFAGSNLPELPFANGANDILSYDIQHRLMGSQSYSAFCNKYTDKLSSQHVVLMMRTLYKEYSSVVPVTPNKSKLEYISLFKRLNSMYTAQNSSFDSQPSLLNFITIMTSEELRTSHLISPKTFSQVESVISRNLAQYKDSALNLCLEAFSQANYSPLQLISALKADSGHFFFCSHKTLFNVANTLLRMGHMDDAMFVHIYNRALALFDKFNARDLVRGVEFFLSLRRSGYFSSAGRDGTLRSQYEPMVQHMIDGLLSISLCDACSQGADWRHDHVAAGAHEYCNRGIARPPEKAQRSGVPRAQLDRPGGILRPHSDRGRPVSSPLLVRRIFWGLFAVLQGRLERICGGEPRLRVAQRLRTIGAGRSLCGR